MSELSTTPPEWMELNLCTQYSRKRAHCKTGFVAIPVFTVAGICWVLNPVADIEMGIVATAIQLESYPPVLPVCTVFDKRRLRPISVTVAFAIGGPC